MLISKVFQKDKKQKPDESTDQKKLCIWPLLTSAIDKEDQHVLKV